MVSALDGSAVEERLAEVVAFLGASRAVVLTPHRSSVSLAIPCEFVAPPPEASGRLAFDDRAIDLLIIDEPVAMARPVDLGALLRDCWRVSRLGLVVVAADRGPVETSRLESLLGEVIAGPVRTTQLEGTTLFIASRQSDVPGAQSGLIQLEQQLWAAQTHAANLRSELTRMQRERDVAQHRISELENGLAARLAESPLSRKLIAPIHRASNGLSRITRGLRDRGISWPDSFIDDIPALRSEPDLRFAGLATRARPADPDEFLEARHRTVALCHPHWRGIRAATMDQNEAVIEVPGFETRGHALRFASFLRDAGAECVVMNGYPPGTERLAQALHEVAPRIRFSIVYHGTPALSYGEDVVLQSMLELFQRGQLYKLGFVKHGLAEYFRFRGARAEWVMNRCSMPPMPPAPLSDGRVKVGVFAPSASHKNVETQLIAALLVPGSEVHTIEPVKAAYLQAESHRVRAHGLKPRPEFLELLRTMQAATYVSLVECYPMTVLESILSGVICVTSNTSVLFDDVPELREALVVAHHDSPAAIASKICSALEQRETLIPKAQAHLQELNLRAEKRWHEFLED